MRPYACVMERGKCLMSMKLRPVVMRETSDAALLWPFGGDRAFAAVEKYGGGGGGGCMWPPRSYSCSFCGREFKSAQALGGHMNVHRRDRARLKQQSLSTDQATSLDHDHQEPQKQQEFLDVGSKFLVQEDSRKPNATKRDINDVVNSNVLQSSMERLEHCNDEVKTDLSVGLVSSEFNHRKKQPVNGFPSSKKAKTDVSSWPVMLGLVIGVSKINSHHEELDLELRLGAHPSKVN